MKKVFLLFFLFSSLFVFAQEKVDLNIHGDIKSIIKKEIITNTTSLIESINSAYRNESALLNYSNIDISDKAIISVNALWANSHFSFPQLDISTTILVRSNKQYEVRNIPIYIKEADPEDRSQNMVILFDENGGINDLFISIGHKNFKSIMPEEKEIKDLSHREILLDFIESFYTAYYRKDFGYIRNIFSEQVADNYCKKKKETKEVVFMSDNIKNSIYYERMKKEYLSQLGKVFETNQYINIKFDNIKIVEHRRIAHLYGVNIQQYWNSMTYSDKGNFFFLVDLRNSNKPKILIRIWNVNDDIDMSSFNIYAD